MADEKAEPASWAQHVRAHRAPRWLYWAVVASLKVLILFTPGAPRFHVAPSRANGAGGKGLEPDTLPEVAMAA